MKSRALGLIFLVSLALMPASSATPPRSGAICDKQGLTKVYDGLTFTCKKFKKKLVWSAGTRVKKPIPTPTAIATPTPTPIASPTPTPTPTFMPAGKKYFSSPCELDPDTPEEWKGFEKKHIGTGGCLSPLRVPTTAPLVETPKTAESLQKVDLSKCKIRQNPNKTNTIGFPDLSDTSKLNWFNSTRHPSPNTVYQVIPLYSDDIPNLNTKPQADFGKYFNFLESWTKQASDNGSSVEIRVPDSYLYFPGKIASYNLIHDRKQSDANRFLSDLLLHVDAKIDFTGSNVLLILFPPSTNKIVGDQIGLGGVRTNEGLVVASVMPSGGDLAFERNFSFPTWWLHELMHVGIGFDDNNHSQSDSPSWWGLISWASAYDLLVWHKWISGFISDTQVICLDKSRESIAYIAPSTVKSARNKAIIIPIDEKKVVVIESQRSEGINYKLPEVSEGALVYLVDTALISHGDGIRLILPQGKRMIQSPNMNYRSSGPNSNASLKLGESATYGGVKITVIESGTYGDVLRIEPTA